MSNATLNAALEYAARGWRVFPCHGITAAGGCTCGAAGCGNAGKHPATARGFKDATTDTAAIRRMNWRARNVGIATGDGLAVIDVDVKNGGVMARNGNGWNITDADGATFHVPESRVIRTGGGGWHWYGRGAAITRANTLGRGIDTRGDGGYVVAPPSIHVTGGVYVVETDRGLADVPADLLALLAAPKPKPKPASKPTPPPTGGTAYGRRALAAELARLRAAVEGERNDALNRAAFALGQLAAGGEIEAAAFDDLLDAARAIGLGDSEAEKTARSGWESGAANPRSAPEKPTATAHAADDAAEAVADTRERIEIHPHRRNAVIRRGAELLRDDVFLRDTMPVVAHTMTDAADVHGVHHPVGGLIIAAATPQHAGHLLNARLAPFKTDSRSKLGLPREYPKPWIEGMLGAATMLGVFRQLLGVVRAPLFDLATGSVTTAGGYDPATRFYVDWHAGLPTIPDRPTETEARAALARLVLPWRGYADRVDAVAIAAAALTAAVRPTLPTAPAIVCDGTVVGCGKGLFARTLSALATGGPPATMNEGASAEELEKRFAAAIISGAPVVLLDNVQRRLASSALESILTEGRADIRLFGTLTSINVACRALMLITANNAAYRADLLRRALPVRIVAKSDTPEADSYNFDPVAEAMRDRAELLAAAFTVLRATVQRQPATPNLGSFERWAALVGGACRWLLGRSPVELIAERKADDPDLAADRAIIEALAEAFPAGKAFRAAEAAVARRTVHRCSGDCAGPCRCAPTEIEIPWVEAPSIEVDGDGRAKNVGYWLRARKDRFFGGLQLTNALDGAGKARWSITGTTTG